MTKLLDNRDGLLSLLVLLVLVVLVFLMVLGPLDQQSQKYQSELRKNQRVLQEMKAIEGAGDELRMLTSHYREKELDALVYQLQTPAEVALDIQRRLSKWLTKSQVHRTTPITGTAESGYIVAGAQVQLTASLPVLMDILQKIETSRPQVVVSSLALSPVISRRRGGAGAEEQLLEVQLTVQTYVPSDDGDVDGI